MSKQFHNGVEDTFRTHVERQRDEAVAMLMEVREWHRCPWKYGASVEVIDLQRHAEWIASLDAFLVGVSTQ